MQISYMVYNCNLSACECHVSDVVSLSFPVITVMFYPKLIWTVLLLVEESKPESTHQFRRAEQVDLAVRHYATNRKVAGSIPDEVNF
jgi:hypothetical protein